jgi:hypothetical protein
MKKNIYYIFGIVLLAVIFYWTYLVFFSTERDTVSIQTKEGNLSVTNLAKVPEAKQLSPQDTLAQSTPDYDIVYFDFGAKDRSFLIDIKGVDITLARTKAEAVFLQLLNITRDQACSLNVSLRVSSNANDKLSGQEFGLSFCPNGKAFPK